jgi:GTP-binding protein
MNITSAEFIKGIVGTNPILDDEKSQVAFIGRSNVGKSSVINSLVNNKNLVKTGKKPGKTTEINFFLINRKFYFVDLPGYGFAEGGKEKIEKIRKLIIWYLSSGEAHPSTVVLIIDIKAGFTQFDKEVIEILREQNHPYLIVANKADKLNQKESAAQLAKIKRESNEEHIVLYSAMNKTNPQAILKNILI